MHQQFAEAMDTSGAPGCDSCKGGQISIRHGNPDTCPLLACDARTKPGTDVVHLVLGCDGPRTVLHSRWNSIDQGWDSCCDGSVADVTPERLCHLARECLLEASNFVSVKSKFNLADGFSRTFRCLRPPTDVTPDRLFDLARGARSNICSSFLFVKSARI